MIFSIFCFQAIVVCSSFPWIPLLELHISEFLHPKDSAQLNLAHSKREALQNSSSVQRSRMYETARHWVFSQCNNKLVIVVNQLLYRKFQELMIWRPQNSMVRAYILSRADREKQLVEFKIMEHDAWICIRPGYPYLEVLYGNEKTLCLTSFLEIGELTATCEMPVYIEILHLSNPLHISAVGIPIVFVRKTIPL